MNMAQKNLPTDVKQKKELQQQKQRFDLHVLLIMQQAGKTKSQALFAAWLEGPSGLARRMPEPVAGQDK